jgi:hypothetical protein
VQINPHLWWGFNPANKSLHKFLLVHFNPADTGYLISVLQANADLVSAIGNVIYT